MTKAARVWPGCVITIGMLIEIELRWLISEYNFGEALMKDGITPELSTIKFSKTSFAALCGNRIGLRLHYAVVSLVAII